LRRKFVTLAPNTLSGAVDFIPDNVTIWNYSSYVGWLNLGGQIAPESALTADYLIPPLSSLSIANPPEEFGFSFGPQLGATVPGFAPRVDIEYTAVPSATRVGGPGRESQPAVSGGLSGGNVSLVFTTALPAASAPFQYYDYNLSLGTQYVWPYASFLWKLPLPPASASPLPATALLIQGLSVGILFGNANTSFTSVTCSVNVGVSNKNGFIYQNSYPSLHAATGLSTYSDLNAASYSITQNVSTYIGAGSVVYFNFPDLCITDTYVPGHTQAVVQIYLAESGGGNPFTLQINEVIAGAQLGTLTLAQ